MARYISALSGHSAQSLAWFDAEPASLKAELERIHAEFLRQLPFHTIIYHLRGFLKLNRSLDFVLDRPGQEVFTIAIGSGTVPPMPDIWFIIEDVQSHDWIPVATDRCVLRATEAGLYWIVEGDFADEANTALMPWDFANQTAQ